MPHYAHQLFVRPVIYLRMVQAENDGLYLGTLKMMAIIDRTTSYERETQKALRSPHYANGWLGTGYAPHLRRA